MLPVSAMHTRKGICFSVLCLLGLVLPTWTVQAAAQTIFPVEPSVALPATGVQISPSILSGDFNGDGLPDTAIAYTIQSPATSTLLVLLNKSGSTPTQVATTLPGCNSPIFALADVNLDHKLDVVLTCGSNFLITLLGKGDGTFQAPILTALPASTGLGYLTLADFNGDGLPDVAYFSGGLALAISLNLGGGTFGNPQSYPFTGVGLYIGSGDFNGDGKQDLIFASGTGSAAYMLGNGDGTFGAQQALPNNFNQFAVGDFNHDGYSDVAYALYGASVQVPAIGVLLGGSSGLAATGETIPVNGASSTFLTATDLNGNGNLDLVEGNLEGEYLLDPPSNTFVLLGDGKGNFSPPISYAADSVYGVADLNGDGVPDLVGVDSLAQPSTLPYAPGKGDGSFAALPNTLYGQTSQGFIVADINGDGVADAILPQEIPVVFVGLGNGRFTRVPTNSDVPPTTLAGSFAAVAADFNGDGKIDVASISSGTTFPPPVNGGILLFLGNGDGTLTFSHETNLSFQGIGSALAGDFNGDKKQDLILLYQSNIGSSNAVLLPGNGDGTFGTPQPIPLLGSSPGAIVSADINGDGIPDLVVADVSIGTTVYLGNGDGTFRNTAQILAVKSTILVVADFTGDGKLDLLAGTGVYSGNGDGTFSSSPIFSLPTTDFDAAVAGDLNGDGFPDIAIQSGTAERTVALNVFLNQGGTSFIEDPTTYFAGAQFGNTINAPPVLARLNSSSAVGGSQQMLDALVYSSGGLTSLLNQLNTAPKPSPTVVVSLADGVTTITVGATVTVSAALSVIGTAAPTGTVAFFTGQTPIGSSSVADGSSSVTAPITGSGTVAIRAVYSGDAVYGSSTGFTSIVVNSPAVTTTTLTASATSVNEQQQITLTATIQGNAPTGAVTFLIGATFLGTAPISNGSARLQVSFNNPGSESITASYGGDPNNLASISKTVFINIAAPSFAVTGSPTSATVPSGQSAAFTITVTPAGGFASPVSLSCGALPSEATCSFSAPTVTPANGQAASAKLTITTVAATANVIQRRAAVLPRSSPWFPAGAVIGLAGLLGFVRGRGQRRRWQRIAALGIAIFCSISLFGCGGGSSSNPPPSNPGTPAGTSTITVSAIATGETSPQTVTLQLVVQ